MLEAWVIILFVFLIVLGVNFLASLMTFTVHKNVGDGIIGWFVVSTIAVVITAIVAAFMYFPYNLKYFTWTAKDGVIAESTFDAKADTSNKTSQGGLRIMLGDGTSFYTTDFRLATKRVGERVSLVCRPSYQEGNVDRIDCRAQIGSA